LAESGKALVLKTSDAKCDRGSNPLLSANFMKKTLETFGCDCNCGCYGMCYTDDEMIEGESCEDCDCHDTEDSPN
jgi:hypothetical protein